MRLFKKIIVSSVLLILAGLVCFWMMQVTPGSFFDELKMNPQIPPDTILYYERLYRVHDPLWVQYGTWLANAVQGNFGYSFFYHVPVADVIWPRLKNTFILSLASLLLTWFVALPLGLCAAYYYHRWVDKVIGIGTQVAFAIPSFLLAIALLFIASQTGLFPLGGMQRAEADQLNVLAQFLDVLHHLILPTLVLSLAAIAYLSRILRANIVQEMNKPYVLAARARGIKEHRIWFHHILPNAFLPMITILGFEFGALISGAAIVEMLTSWPGMGTLMLTAVRSKDIYVVLTIMMASGILLIIGNMIAEASLLALDKRIKRDDIS